VKAVCLDTVLTGRTPLVIAHRPSTIRGTDTILVVDGGRIVERGTHEQLLAVGGHYADLYATQYAAQADRVVGGASARTKERSMRVVRATRRGGPDVLEVADVDLPEPGDGEVLVEVAAAGVNFIDIYRRTGVYPMPYPHVSGIEGAGVVIQLGPGIRSLAVGDRVAWAAVPGSYATHHVVPEDSAVPVPQELDLTTAAAVVVQGITAHFLVNSTYPVSPGEDVLVHAAAGGVGHLLVQLAAAKGAAVIGTVSTAAKEKIAREAGAHHVVRYLDVDDVAAEVRAATTGGRGVAVAYDGVGKDTFDISLATLRRRGMLVLFGGASGQVPPFDPQRLNQGGSLYLTRPTIGDYIADRNELLWRASEVFDAVARGRLHVTIADTLPLEDAGAAHEALAGRQTVGKLILVPGS
jgi:NADPH:quinone reductase